MIFSGVFLMAFTNYNDFQYFVPNNFPKPVYSFQNNPIDSNKIELGRNLFYDPILSLDNTVSCASCHSPFNAFSHTDHKLSHGIYDSIGTRNAPALYNLAWQKKFMWDGAINHLDVQALAPIHNSSEMASSIIEVKGKIQNDKYYRQLFYQSFGDSNITGQNILKALSQFQLTLVSANSKYDKVLDGKAIFSLQEKKGYKLFLASCNRCHLQPLFSTYDFASNGLEIDTLLKDIGRMKISQNRRDSMLFKIPSLRNLSFSYPYMHDGRFSSLRGVLDHYSIMIKNDRLGINDSMTRPFKSDEKTDLIAFLLTLNDTSFVFNPKHQFPRDLMNKKKL
jgi:cytochrome c peroxidase